MLPGWINVVMPAGLGARHRDRAKACIPDAGIQLLDRRELPEAQPDRRAFRHRDRGLPQIDSAAAWLGAERYSQHAICLPNDTLMMGALCRGRSHDLGERFRHRDCAGGHPRQSRRQAPAGVQRLRCGAMSNFWRRRRFRHRVQQTNEEAMASFEQYHATYGRDWQRLAIRPKPKTRRAAQPPACRAAGGASRYRRADHAPWWSPGYAITRLDLRLRYLSRHWRAA